MAFYISNCLVMNLETIETTFLEQFEKVRYANPNVEDENIFREVAIRVIPIHYCDLLKLAQEKLWLVDRLPSG